MISWYHFKPSFVNQNLIFKNEEPEHRYWYPHHELLAHPFAFIYVNADRSLMSYQITNVPAWFSLIYVVSVLKWKANPKITVVYDWPCRSLDWTSCGL
jgi:hypothetical protein